MRRHLPLLAAVVAVLVLAACQTAPAVPDVADPREILRRSVTAMGEVRTFRLAGSASGTLRADVLAAGAPVDVELEGSSVRGDVDLGAEAAHLLARVPGMLGLSVDLIVLPDGIWLKSNLSGGRFERLDGGIGSGGLGEMLDPRAALDALERVLAMPGIEPTKLEDARCGDRACYQVAIDVRPAELVPGGAGSSAGASDPPRVRGTPEASGTVRVTLGVDKETFRLGRLLVGSDSDELGSWDVTIELSGWNESVTIEPPPADEVAPG